MSIATLPRPVLWLGLTGIIPQAACLAAALALPDWRWVALAAGCFYAAVILSFLGGLWWMQALQRGVRGWEPYLWSVATSLGSWAVLVPWALGCFSANSAQQARLVQMSPVLAPATVALNTSAIYGGQAMGAALGGVLIAQGGMQQLHAWGLVLMIGAMLLSVWAARLQKRSPMPS